MRKSNKTVVGMGLMVMALAAPATAQQVISDNDCTISLNPTTVSVPQAGSFSETKLILTASFATQGCSCTEPGDEGFDNPDGIELVTPAGSVLAPFKFNDIDGYAQFDYAVTEADLTAGRGTFVVKIFDSCAGADVLVDQADFLVDIKTVNVPAPPTPTVIHACANRGNGMLRIVGAGIACRPNETSLELAGPAVP